MQFSSINFLGYIWFSRLLSVGSQIPNITLYISVICDGEGTGCINNTKTGKPTKGIYHLFPIVNFETKPRTL